MGTATKNDCPFDFYGLFRLLLSSGDSERTITHRHVNTITG